MEEKMTIQQETVSAFINRWIALSKPDSILLLKIPNWNTFPPIENPNIHTITQADYEEIQSKYDLIIGDLPIGLMNVDYDYHGDKLRISQNYKEILHSLDYLNDTGFALYILEPMGFGSEKGKRFETVLNKYGFFVSAYIRLPEGIFKKKTAITPIIVVLKKQKSPYIFTDELLDPIQAEYLVDNYFSLSKEQIPDKTTSGLSAVDLKLWSIIASYSPLLKREVTATVFEPGIFKGFTRLKAQRQIEMLQTQYKNYSQRTLGELAKAINSVPSRGTFTEIPNSIYIPKIGNSPVVSDLKDTTLKHHNYYQVVLDETVNNAYLAAFFRTKLGNLILESAFSESFISSLNRSDVEKLQVAVPKLEEQLSIVETFNSLSRLRVALTEYESELALNPTSSISIQPRLDSMLDAIGVLTEIDKIKALIREGESKRLEFKPVLCPSSRNQPQQKRDFETESLKTVVAFLNSDGGNLLVGVSDDGKILGLNQEINNFHKNSDKFLLYWKNLVRDHIGRQSFSFIDSTLIDIDGKQVLFVDVKPSPSQPFFVNFLDFPKKSDFYIRTNPSSELLVGQELYEYLKTRFSS